MEKKEGVKNESRGLIKIVSIVGARPQFIKLAPLAGALRDHEDARHIIVHTGQHYDYNMSKTFFDELGIPDPAYHLGVGSAAHGYQTGEMLKGAEEVLLKEGPDEVLVYGDTNSTLAGALAAAKLHIPVGHIEAGLRSYNRRMAEEINRVLVDHISSLLFCPTETAVCNLREEGFKNIINDGRLIKFSSTQLPITSYQLPVVVNVGDIMYDLLLYAIKIAEKQSKILEELQLTSKEYCLLTLHRAENTDNQKRFEEIIGFVNDVSLGKTIIFPVHPRTKKAYESAGRKFTDNVKISEPLGYFDVLILLKNASLILTDSGGMQKEAYWLKIPCITLRDETEWVETIQSGWNVLYKDYNGSHKPSDTNRIPYGDGKAAERIVNLLITNEKSSLSPLLFQILKFL